MIFDVSISIISITVLILAKLFLLYILLSDKSQFFSCLISFQILSRPLIFVVKPEEENMVLKNRFGGFLPSTVLASVQFEALVNVKKAEIVDELIVEIKVRHFCN